MILTIEKNDLLKAIGTAIRAVPSKASLPILENFLFKVEGGILTVTATDTNLTIITTINAEGEGETCVPAKMLADIVRTLPTGSITISTEEDKVCNIEHATGKLTLPCYGVEDFPTVETIPSDDFTKVKGLDLLSALRRTIPCMGSDPLRPTMSGVFFHRVGNILNLVATDSRVLTVCPINAEGGNAESFIVPGNAASFVKDNIADEVELLCKDGAIFFRLGDTVIQCRKVEGKFPNYGGVIPQKTDNILSCDKDKLSKVIKRVSICSNKANNHIKLALGFHPVIEAQDLGFGTSAHEELSFAEYEGVEMQIGFKADYLTKIIDSQIGDSLEISLTDPRRAALITSEGDESRAIVMPVAIQQN